MITSFGVSDLRRDDIHSAMLLRSAQSLIGFDSPSRNQRAFRVPFTAPPLGCSRPALHQCRLLADSAIWRMAGVGTLGPEAGESGGHPCTVRSSGCKLCRQPASPRHSMLDMWGSLWGFPGEANEIRRHDNHLASYSKFRCKTSSDVSRHLLPLHPIVRRTRACACRKTGV
jgi:hypothetical protein